MEIKLIIAGFFILIIGILMTAFPEGMATLRTPLYYMDSSPSDNVVFIASIFEKIAIVLGILIILYGFFFEPINNFIFYAPSVPNPSPPETDNRIPSDTTSRVQFYTYQN